MTKVRDIAKMLNTTESTNSDNKRLVFTQLDSDLVNTVAAASDGNFASYSSIDSLPVQSISAGATAYVTSLQRYYMYEGSGWYNIHLDSEN